MTTPENIKYTKDHEWASKEESGEVTVGITHYAQEQLCRKLSGLGAKIPGGKWLRVEVGGSPT